MALIDRRTQLKARRAIRKQKRQVEAATASADDSIDRLVLKRFSRLLQVKRFVLIWTALVFLLGSGSLWQVRALDKFYLVKSPVAGGIYREGIVGVFTNANPIFATSQVDVSVSKLLFSGLFTVSPSGKVVGDLAKSVVIDDTGEKYTVELREDVFWHDGERFDSKDVVYTYKTIQNPTARSPLLASWRGVKVTAVNDYTVVFELPNVLSSFELALTNGIIPEHKLKDVDLQDIRSASFNTIDAVGTGPFTLRTLEVVGASVETRQERIALNKFDNYHLQTVGLDGVIIRSYRSDEAMRKDFDDQIIQSMVGLSSVEDMVGGDDVSIKSVPLTSAVMIFLNNSNPILNDKKVRQALVQATDTDEIRKSLNFQPVQVDSPFLKSQFAYNSEITQLPYDIDSAKRLLDETGWILNSKNQREKDGVEMSFRLVSQSLSDYALISQKLQKAWGELGVKVEAILQPEEDIQSGAIARHDYDVLLYGISIGYDPDVFAYWHSSQTDPNAQSQLNLSEYKSEVADAALEAGRTRIDQDLRKVKYEPFLKAWRDDAPAIALYQPRFTMVVSGTLEGFGGGQFLKASDRFNTITDWKIRNAEVIK